MTWWLPTQLGWCVLGTEDGWGQWWWRSAKRWSGWHQLQNLSGAHRLLNSLYPTGGSISQHLNIMWHYMPHSWTCYFKAFCNGTDHSPGHLLIITYILPLHLIIILHTYIAYSYFIFCTKAVAVPHHTCKHLLYESRNELGFGVVTSQCEKGIRLNHTMGPEKY